MPDPATPAMPPWPPIPIPTAEIPTTSGLRLKPIGNDGEPVRALAFAGGGFDTAMQLGITHALLVSQAKPPDVVVGASAGAISAVALAEVLQTQDPVQQVRRFREIYEAYLGAPSLIRQGYRPDTFQVDTQRPLESLELPVDHRREREEREAAVASRAGLINFFNTLLRLNLRIGTVTRGIRRALGYLAAGEIRSLPGRVIVRGIELFRSLALVGQNLHRMTVLVWPAVKANFHSELRKERGATAGELIFRSGVFTALLRAIAYGFSLGLLVSTWLLVVAALVVVLTLVGLIVVLPIELIRVLALNADPAPWPVLFLTAFPVSALIPLLIVAATRPNARAVGNTFWIFLMFAVLVAVWVVVLAAALALPRAAYLMLSGAGTWGPWHGGVYGLVVVILAAALGLLGLVMVGLIALRRREFGRRFLRQFGIANSILDPYPLRQLLVSLFDRDYYGRPDMRRVVETALEDGRGTQDGPRNEKRVEGYAAVDKQPPIHVGITVADLATGEFKVLPGSWRVVDALSAALAAVPLFPPISCDRPWPWAPADGGNRSSRTQSLLVDSANVANEPTRPLFSFLRHSGLVNPNASALHLYTVSPVPFVESKLGPESQPDGRPVEYTSLVDVAFRAWELRRFRDATLERRLTELHTKAMPPDGTIFYPEGPDQQKPLLRSWCFPIEPHTPLRANEGVFRSESSAEARRIIGEAVAEGCRAALQVMLDPAIAEEAKRAADQAQVLGIGKDKETKPGPTNEQQREPIPTKERQLRAGVTSLSCAAVVRRHLGPRVRLQGSAPETSTIDNPGPGLSEVCECCALYRQRLREDGKGPAFPRMLEVPDAGAKWSVPGWPHRDQATRGHMEPARKAGYQRDRNKAVIQGHWKNKWPSKRTAIPHEERPAVSLLFSGGVFRGVFQIGALNALSEVSLVPDVVAGASVGSITAAMAARAFLSGTDPDPEVRRAERARFILPLSAAYLAIDRLILTDRFSDFIRGATIRAARASFSLHDADRVFRRYDSAWPGAFSRESRRVAAGIERLAYISPFELVALLEAMRLQQFGKTVGLMKQYFQEWLDRIGVGQEILGAEPLTRLINEYVLRGFPRYENVPSESVPFRAFSKGGLFFLATGTNLTEGCLEILGRDQLENPEVEITVQGTLLASSAFPGVFRPRWSWEFEPTTSAHHQYIDGGTVDNLPLDAVAEFLLDAARAELLPMRPSRAPHLIFAASLEPQVGPAPPELLDELRGSWPLVIKHARSLRYNQKLDVFDRTQRNLRRIVEHRNKEGPPFGPDDWIPLDLEVVSVIPRWLCGTFAFHPMLGFRRARQARSIAHGCAATLLRLAQLRATEQGESWLTAWGIEPGRLPSAAQAKAPDPFVPNADRQHKGDCWYRPGILCPFSTEGQKADRSPVCDRTRDELAGIYAACGRQGTHRDGR